MTAADTNTPVEVDTTAHDEALAILDELRDAYIKAEAELYMMADDFPDAHGNITAYTDVFGAISKAIRCVRSSKRTAITIAETEARLTPKPLADMQWAYGANAFGVTDA